jgi:sodium-dependent phosphate transporter
VLIVWKGGASRIKLTNAETIGVIIGVGAAVALLVAVFFLPYLYRKLMKDDWELKWYQIALGPLLLKRGEVTPSPEASDAIVQNYYRGHLTLEELRAREEQPSPSAKSDIESHPETNEKAQPIELPPTAMAGESTVPVPGAHKSIIGPRPEGSITSPNVLFWFFKKFFFHGVDKDVVAMQSGDKSFLTGDLEKVHAHAEHYNNKVEYMYSFLQVMTAATSSFTHGANDVSKYVYGLWPPTFDKSA